jgi:branched-chain amino acid transport system substrate-binding protein
MDAVERAGAAEPAKIRDALTKTDYEGPNGKFQFDAKGQAYGFNIVLVQLHDGKPVVVATTSLKE